MSRAGASLALLMLMAGCTSWVQKVVPGEPVTAERCRAMDVENLGYQDGLTGQRPGERYDFWMKDCRSTGAPIDRAAYDKGYDRGMARYCSCENGFGAGVREEFTEFKGQFYNCGKQRYQRFLKGHEAGSKQAGDTQLWKQTGPYQKSYMSDLIETRATEACAKIPVEVVETQLDKKKTPVQDQK